MKVYKDNSNSMNIFAKVNYNMTSNSSIPQSELVEEKRKIKTKKEKVAIEKIKESEEQIKNAEYYYQNTTLPQQSEEMSYDYNISNQNNIFTNMNNKTTLKLKTVSKKAESKRSTSIPKIDIERIIEDEQQIENTGYNQNTILSEQAEADLQEYNSNQMNKFKNVSNKMTSKKSSITQCVSMKAQSKRKTSYPKIAVENTIESEQQIENTDYYYKSKIQLEQEEVDPYEQNYNQMNEFTSVYYRTNSKQSSMPKSVQIQSQCKRKTYDPKAYVERSNTTEQQMENDVYYFQNASLPQQAEVKPYEQLEKLQINGFNDLFNIKNQLEMKMNWNEQFNALQQIRSILKYHPEEVNNLYQYYGEAIVKIYQSNKTLLVKGCLALISETFNIARQHKLNDEIISVFIKLLFQKLFNNTLKALDDWIKYVLTCFVNNTYDYDVSYVCLLSIPAQQQKKIQTTQLIQSLLDKKRDTLCQLNQNTFIALMRYMCQQSSLISSKKVYNPYLQLSMSLIDKIGENAFLSIMQHSLNNDQMQYMVSSLQNYGNVTKTKKSSQKTSL